MDSILTIIFFIVAALIHAAMKKKQDSDAGEAGVPPALPPSPRQDHWSGFPGSEAGSRLPRRSSSETRPQSLEELLRRVLEPESQTTAPPVITSLPPRPPLPPPVIRQQEEGIDDEHEGLSVPLPSLTESARAYERASQIESSIAARLRGADARVISHTPEPLLSASAREPHPSLTWIQSPESVRTAFVTSLVLGPPKALES